MLVGLAPFRGILGLRHLRSAPIAITHSRDAETDSDADADSDADSESDRTVGATPRAAAPHFSPASSPYTAIACDPVAMYTLPLATVGATIFA
jgi:hypothetical protein